MMWEIYFGFNTIPCTEFIYSVFIGDVGRVRQLLNSNETLAHSTDEDGNPAVNWAISQGKPEMLRELLKHKPKLSASRLGDPIDIAVRVAAPEVMTELLAFNAVDLEARNILGATLLLIAVNAGRIDIAQLLVQNGADVQAVDRDNNSALHYAANTGNESLLKAVISFGIDPSLRDAHGRTALKVLSSRVFNDDDRSLRRDLIDVLKAHERSRPSVAGGLIARIKKNF